MLKFAVICCNESIARYQQQCIHTLCQSSLAECACVILVESNAAPPRRRGFGPGMHSKQLLSIDTGLIQNLANTPRIDCRSQLTDGQDIPDAAAKTIQNRKLDFILDFRTQPTRPTSNLAEYGIWTFGHLLASPSGAERPFLEDVISSRKTVLDALVRLEPPPSPNTTLRQGQFRMIPYSYSRTADLILEQCSRWPLMACIDIALSNQRKTTFAPTPATRQRLPLPTLRYTASKTARYIRTFVDRHFVRNIWSVAIVNSGLDELLKSQGNSHFEHTTITSRQPEGFLADPFCLQTDDGMLCLAEDYDARTRKGHIAAIDIHHPQQPPVPAISEEHHLSYPFLFEHDGAVHCIPEAYQSGGVWLHTLLAEPNQWEKTLLIENLPAVDPTLLRHNGKWWLFCTRRDDISSANLYIYHADDVTGPWKPHANNPVKQDASNSRPAGAFIQHKGFLLRPAQDCSRGYGGKVLLNRVVHLSENDYAETPYTHLCPQNLFTNAGYSGLHTVNVMKDCIVVDIKRTIIRFPVISKLLSFRQKQ